MYFFDCENCVHNSENFQLHCKDCPFYDLVIEYSYIEDEDGDDVQIIDKYYCGNKEESER